jgi:hypothetical protein
MLAWPPRVQACAIFNEGLVGEVKRDDGLVEGHAFSLLELVLVGELRLVQLRNPWGSQQEWRGEWSDESAAWAAHPEAAEACRFEGPADNGLFWMSWDDFSGIFDQICVCSTVAAAAKASEAGAPFATRRAATGAKRAPGVLHGVTSTQAVNLVVEMEAFDGSDDEEDEREEGEEARSEVPGTRPAADGRPWAFGLRRVWLRDRRAGTWKSSSSAARTAARAYSSRRVRRRAPIGPAHTCRSTRSGPCAATP